MRKALFFIAVTMLAAGCEAETFTEDAAITYKFIVQNKTNETEVK